MTIVSAPILLLASAVLHATWNTMTKVSKDKESFVFVTVVLACLWVLLAKMIYSPQFIFGGQTGFNWGLLAGIFEGGYLVALSKSFNRTSLAKGYSIMRGGAMVFVWGVSLIFSMEHMNWLSLLGSSLILGGIIVTGAGKTTPNTTTEKKNELVWPILGAIFIAGYHLCYSEGMKNGAQPEALYMTALVVSLPFIYVPVRKNFLARCKTTLGSEKLKLLASTIGASLGFVMFLYGLSRSGPGYAITLRNTSIFFSIWFSFLIRDHLTRLQVIGASVIGIGALIMGVSS